MGHMCRVGEVLRSVIVQTAQQVPTETQGIRSLAFPASKVLTDRWELDRLVSNALLEQLWHEEAGPILQLAVLALLGNIPDHMLVFIKQALVGCAVRGTSLLKEVQRVLLVLKTQLFLEERGRRRVIAKDVPPDIF